MEWIPDPSAGEWLRERLEADLGVVPHGYAAYARVFHPADVLDEAAPGGETEIRWKDTAAAFGTTMHPLAQWHRLTRTVEGEDWHRRRSPDGREFRAPFEGELAPESFAPLAKHLTRHTATPDDGVAAVWEGYGDLLGHFGEGPSRVFFTIDDEDPAAAAHRKVLDNSFHDPFNNPYRKATWQEGILSREISESPRLELPGRSYVLFSAAARAFTDPDWVLAAPWRDRPAEERGFPPQAHHPNILWPADHAWVVVSEIDFDSTIVCGSAELVAALCADPELEAWPIPEGADLTWDGDEVNR